MKKSHINNVGVGLGIGIAGALVASPAQAEVSISENQAQTEPIPINLNSGQTSAIHFQNNHQISYLILSDRSKIVYSLNAPTDSGQAKSIFLRQIEPLDFPGETTSNQPNLFVVALDDQGVQREYEFVIDSSQNHDSKINIVPEKKRAKKKPINVINTELGAASPEDIRIGLKHKLRVGELTPDDPIALYTSEAIAITLNEDRTLLALAQEMEIPISVLSEFGRTGLAQKAKFRIKKAENNQANLLSATRRSLIKDHSNNFLIDTDLGEANLKDIRFGLSVMLKRGYLNRQEGKEISEVLGRIKTNNINLSAEEKEELQRVGRLGLAFNARQRIMGTLD